MTNSTVALTLPAAKESSRAGEAQTARGPRVFCHAMEYVTNARFEITDITARIASTVRESGVRDGIVHIQTLHTTTALFLNESQQALLHDFETLARMLVDENRSWRHNDPNYSDCDRGNAAAHLRSLLLGHSLTLQIQAGRLLLGQWQAVLFAELDGPRNRNLSVQMIGV